jgi:hypothetical protein
VLGERPWRRLEEHPIASRLDADADRLAGGEIVDRLREESHRNLDQNLSAPFTQDDADVRPVLPGKLRELGLETGRDTGRQIAEQASMGGRDVLEEHGDQ